MQFSKDSFYLALRDRLAVINPLRTITLDGAVRPALVVAQNEPVGTAEALRDTFYVWWGNAAALKGHGEGKRPLFALDCAIFYHTQGTADDGSDRGRALAQMDLELSQMCSPAYTAKLNATLAVPLNLGTDVLWTRPEPEALAARDLELSRRAAADTSVWRKAKLMIFYFPEVDVP